MRNTAKNLIIKKKKYSDFKVYKYLSVSLRPVSQTAVHVEGKKLVKTFGSTNRPLIRLLTKLLFQKYFPRTNTTENSHFCINVIYYIYIYKTPKKNQYIRNNCHCVNIYIKNQSQILIEKKKLEFSKQKK